MCFWGWRFPYFWNGGFENMFFMMFFGLTFWVSIILLIIYAIKNFFQRSKSNKEEILNMLKRRFASGEITQEEYEKIKKILEI